MRSAAGASSCGLGPRARLLEELILLVLGPVLVMVAVVLTAAAVTLALGAALSRRAVPAVSTIAVAVGCSAAHAVLPGRPLLPAVLAGAALVAAGAGYAARRPELTAPGALLWVSWITFGAVTSAWGALFLAGLSLSRVTAVLLCATVGLAAITLPSAVITTREGWEPVLRRRWRRPREPLAGVPASFPRVSIHVPCHAEPPELVISTLDRLAELDYPNFEVLVIDNNTVDPRLWQPVRAHCRELGRRFRFFHVEGLAGAKAGALNFALRHTDPAARLVGVVDADYHVEPDWLNHTVGYFDDARMGFVQCPHAYRDFAGSRFGRWANAEYSVFFAAGMVSLNEHNAGLTVGTMSLIRKEALERVGGWAQWCLTEDSELAIRVHAAGFDSVYLRTAYGRGLIPETFAGYRKQRFRWTYGPVQEFRRHWRLFLPRRLGGRPSRLTPTQKLHHANHGLDVIGVGLRALTVPLAAATAVSMLVHHEHIPVPVELWAASTSVLMTDLLLRYLVYTRVVGATIRQAVGGALAFAALYLVIAHASLQATTGASAYWHRTAKFRPARKGSQVIAGEAAAESGAALACLIAAVLLFTLPAIGGLVTMLAIALVLQAVQLAAAPLLAVIADRHLAPAPAYVAKHRSAAEQARAA